MIKVQRTQNFVWKNLERIREGAPLPTFEKPQRGKKRLLKKEHNGEEKS